MGCVWMVTILGHRGDSKCLYAEFRRAFVFSVFSESTIKGKTMGKTLKLKLLLGYTIVMITVHAQGQHMWPSPGPGPDSKCSESKTLEIGCSC